MYNLKQNIESYAYLYEQYEESQKTIKSLEKQSVKDKRKYKDMLSKATNTPAYIIEVQKRQIEELTAQCEDLLKRNEELSEIAKKTKQVNETNRKLKEDNLKLKQTIEYLKD